MVAFGTSAYLRAITKIDEPLLERVHVALRDEALAWFDWVPWYVAAGVLLAAGVVLVVFHVREQRRLVRVLSKSRQTESS